MNFQMLYRDQWVKMQLSLPTYMDLKLSDIKQHWGLCDDRWNNYKQAHDGAVARGDIFRCLREPDTFLASVMAVDLTGHCPGCTSHWDQQRDRLRRQVAEIREFSDILS